jgi:hypothetical protein
MHLDKKQVKEKMSADLIYECWNVMTPDLAQGIVTQG